MKRGKLFADFTDTLALYKNMSKANAALVVKLIADELLATVLGSFLDFIRCSCEQFRCMNLLIPKDEEPSRSPPIALKGSLWNWIPLPLKRSQFLIPGFKKNIP